LDLPVAFGPTKNTRLAKGTLTAVKFFQFFKLNWVKRGELINSPPSVRLGIERKAETR
jgi:hypothetical protein